MSITVQEGSFEKGVTTEANSLVSNLNKYPEIERALVDLYPQYHFYWLFEKLNQFAGEKANKDNSYEWKVRKRLDAPSIAAAQVNSTDGDVSGAMLGTASAYADTTAYSIFQPDSDTVDVDDCFFLAIKDNAAAEQHVWVNPQDIIQFQSGAQMIVWKVVDSFAVAGNTASNQVDAGTKGLICKSISGTPTSDDLAEDAVIANIGDAFGEGSYGGYENKVRETTKRNWLTKTRRAYTITGDAMTNVSWINYGGQSLWYFTEEQDTEKIFKYQFEKRIRYAKTAMRVTGAPSNGDPAGSHLYPGGSGSNQLTWTDNGDSKNDKAPEIGNGLYPQFETVNNGAYSKGTGMTEEGLQNYVARLAQSSPQGSEGNEWLVMASTYGRVQFAKAMKELVISQAAGGSYTMLNTGTNVALGANFTTYHTLGNKFTIVQDYTLDDPNIYGTGLTLGSGGSQVSLSGTGDLIFLNMNKLMNGQSNISLLTKYKRSYRTKYIDGMMTLSGNDNDAFAANGFDGAKREWLAHSGVVLRNPLTCGKYVGVA